MYGSFLPSAQLVCSAACRVTRVQTLSAIKMLQARKTSHTIQLGLFWVNKFLRVLSAALVCRLCLCHPQRACAGALSVWRRLLPEG